MKRIKICKKCVQPNTRPGISFDKNGICEPCNVYDSYEKIDWNGRRKELLKIVEWGKLNSKSKYNCIISASGGKDSQRQALYARDELGMIPLLVSSTIPPEQLIDRGTNNISTLISLGFDIINVGPAPGKWKSMMKKSFYKYGNMGRSTELTLYATAPIVAIKYGIPLIFLGENNALVYGDIGGSDSGDANKMKYNNTLGGGNPKEYMDNWMSNKDVFWYNYPSDEEMQKANLRIVYLGYYIEDFNNKINGQLAIKNGLETRNETPEETGALYNFDALDEDFVHVNQLLKYIKFGFGKVTDEVSEAIRMNEMTRQEGVELVKKYDGKCSPKFIKAFCEYLEITEKEFWRLANSFRDTGVWKKDKKGNWKLRYEL